METSEIAKALPFFKKELIEEIAINSEISKFPPHIELLREGQYVKVIPVVIDGLVKVYTRHEDKELLLYYIEPGDSCVMSFSASLKNDPSRVFAVTEEATTALLLPVSKIPNWLQTFPEIHSLFYQQYNLRYSELLDTINHILFDKMDKRLLDYLREKSRVTQRRSLQISHRQIAAELGTAREVISRVMKKLEVEGQVKQHQGFIELLSGD
ncbi:MAG: Crp/Fnr family transcriptional regulator [Bacteroidota bacterium]